MLASDSNSSLNKAFILKDERRSTFDKANPIYSKGNNASRRKSSHRNTGTNSGGNELSLANLGGSGVDLRKINSDLKNVNESIEIQVRVRDR